MDLLHLHCFHWPIGHQASKSTKAPKSELT
jgi:hypothetical protein